MTERDILAVQRGREAQQYYERAQWLAQDGQRAAAQTAQRLGDLAYEQARMAHEGTGVLVFGS
jgi:hypothetical protein